MLFLKGSSISLQFNWLLYVKFYFNLNFNVNRTIYIYIYTQESLF